MNKKQSIIAAIDIGTTKIVTIVGALNENNKLQILGISKMPSKGVKRGVVLNIEETVESITKTVEEAQNQSGILFSDVFVGIAGQHIRSMRNRGYIYRESGDDEITRSDINKLITDMHRTPVEIGEEIIHVLPQNYIVDSETGVKNPVGMSGRRLEGNFHLVIAQIASAKNISKCVSRVGLKVNSLILEPLASAAAVLTDDEKEAGVALIDIGGGTTDVAVYYDEIIRHTAVIPFGGNVITKDIKEGCSILQRYAEKLKIEYGSALGDLAADDQVVTIPGISGREAKEISFKSLAYIIQSRMEEIIDAVMFEIENSGQLDKLSAGIVITGGGALLKHLPQLMKFRTGLDVRLGLPAEHLASDSLKQVNQPQYSTSAGLLLKGLEYMQENEMTMKTAEPKKVDNTLEEEETEETKDDIKDDKERKSIFDSLKKSISDIFEEKDASM
jgi:cell division protein FtsA